jgi:ABC-2 type transport system permease protein
MIGSIGRRYLTATHYALLGQAKNRMAIILLIAFVPIWYYIMGLFTDRPLDVKFWFTGTFLHVSSRNLSLLTAGLSAITLIVGFMLFTSTRKDRQFDRRLVLNGYPQPLLILAKLTSLVAVAAAVSLYASGILLIFWRPGSLLVVWLGFFCAALCYGGFGLLLGVLLRGELEGFFLIIMVSLIDTFFQNPVGYSSAASQSFIVWFPSFAPTQISVAGGFTHLVPWSYVLVSLAWFVAFALLGLAIFWWKTRAWRVHTTVSSPSLVSHSGFR